MSLAQNKAIARRWAIDLWAKGDVTIVNEIVSPAFASNGHAESLDKVRQDVRDLHAAYTDIQVTLEEQIAEGDMVVNRIVGYATFKGATADSAESQNLAITQVDIFRVVDGKIVELRAVRNSLDDPMD